MLSPDVRTRTNNSCDWFCRIATRAPFRSLPTGCKDTYILWSLKICTIGLNGARFPAILEGVFGRKWLPVRLFLRSPLLPQAEDPETLMALSNFEVNKTPTRKIRHNAKRSISRYFRVFQAKPTAVYSPGSRFTPFATQLSPLCHPKVFGEICFKGEDRNPDCCKQIADIPIFPLLYPDVSFCVRMPTKKRSLDEGSQSADKGTRTPTPFGIRS